MVSAVDYLILDKRRIRNHHHYREKTALVDNYSDDSRRSECFDFNTTWIIQNFLQKEIDRTRLQQRALEEELLQRKEELIERKPQIVFETGLRKLQQEQEEFDMLLAKENLKERWEISQKHAELCALAQTQKQELDEVSKELFEGGKDLLEMQCEAVRFPISLDAAQDALLTEQNERLEEQNEMEAILQQKKEEHKQRQELALGKRRVWLASINQNYTKQLQASEESWITTRKATRDTKLEIRSMELRISELAQERTCLNVMMQATLALLCQRLWQVSKAMVGLLAKVPRAFRQQIFVQRCLKYVKSIVFNILGRVQRAVAPRRITSAFWSIVFYCMEKWNQFGKPVIQKGLQQIIHRLSKITMRPVANTLFPRPPPNEPAQEQGGRGI